MNGKIERLDLRSQDPLVEKHAALKAAFPEAFTDEGEINFDRLKLALGAVLETGRERYGMTWPGKSDCFKTIQQPSVATLVPVRAESEDFDATGNIAVEGDNLEILKLLQKAYLGTIKMIYIDPPYNTGSDFIYPDNYSESLDTYLRYTGQVDGEGRKYSRNTEADGRFHSKWLNMMYPRLYLARNLLREDGVIFISIDDHESDNLKKLCNEIFGEENFICSFAWEKRYSPPPDTKEVGYVHESILFYRKSDQYQMGLLPLTDEQKARYKNPDNDPRGPWKPMDYTCRYTADERPNLFYAITQPNTGRDVWPKRTRVWAYSKDLHQRNEREQRIWWGVDGTAGVPALKNFLSEIQQGMMPMSLLKHDVVGSTDEATKELREFFPSLKYTPKPVRLIRHLLKVANVKACDIVLDFFAGSGTTGHAVVEDGTDLKFILIQLPEPTGIDEYPTLFGIVIGRMRLLKKRGNVASTKRKGGGRVATDEGFRVFKLQSSNFKTWSADAPRDEAALAQQLEMHVHHIVEGRSQEDLLFEILLKSGFPLTTPIETLTLAGKTVFSIADGAMLICLEKALGPEVVKEIAARKPERVVCLDEGFAGNDQLKTNAVQTMKTKGVTSFRTV